MEQTINANLNQCFRAISNFGSTTYQNICNDTSRVVPWGTMDWIIMLFVLTLLLFVIGGLIGMFISVKRY